MITKILYVAVDTVAIIDIVALICAFAKVRSQTQYAAAMVRTLTAAIAAISANMFVAFSNSTYMAEIAYCVYFASIDWILFFLAGFCLRYTEHEKALKILRYPAAFIMALDSALIMSNPVFEMYFTVYEKLLSGTVFYQTAFNPLYYLHLAVDYLGILITLIFMIYSITQNYGIYRAKYVIINAVLLLVVAMNIIYMALSLVLDASVILYALAGNMIYFCTERLVPRRLMTSAVTRAVDDMSEGLILFDINNRCIYANAFSKKNFDVDTETLDFKKEPIATVISRLDDFGRRFGEVPYEKEEAGEKKHYKVRYTSLTDKKMRPIGSYFLIQDTTEEVYYLHEIEEARISADRANQAKSTFLANMSHEIRTPLNSVLGMNEMILRSSDDPKIREYAQTVKTSGDTLLGLINDILDFSKIEAGKMDIINAEYDPHKMIRDCFHIFRIATDEKKLYLNINYDETIPARLLGDSVHIRQILNNLISNAVKYTAEGGITITVKSSRTGYDRIDLVAEVSDTGPGIKPEDKDALFEAFKRIDEKANATIQGTGLGLAITKQLVTLMNGDIDVESSPGMGSTFKVRIPQGIADPSPSGRLVLAQEMAQAAYRESFWAPGARILVVDDVVVNLKVANALLKDTMVKVDNAISGDEAIAMCQKTKYDVILLDHRMPNKDGIETFKEISGGGLNSDTPVVMLTANAIQGVEEEYMEMGFAGYLSKPIETGALEEMLIKLLPEDKVKRRQ